MNVTRRVFSAHSALYPLAAATGRARRRVVERGSELGRLPPHHIRRPRLTARCQGAGVVVVEAAAGYGKTVLGTELADLWRSVAIEVVLHEGGMPAQLFAARLRTAAAHAGFSEAAATMAEAGEDAMGAVDALLGALAQERCTFIVDDAHHAGRGAGLLIERLAEQLQPDQHLVVLARRLPEGTARLRRADCVQLTAADLALRPEETLQLCRAGFGLDIGPAEVARLERSTGGWTAATTLAAARAQRTGEDVSVLAAASDPDQPFSAVAAILHEALDTLPPAERQALAQVGRLPLLDAPTVDTATRDRRLLRPCPRRRDSLHPRPGRLVGPARPGTRLSRHAPRPGSRGAAAGRRRVRAARASGRGAPAHAGLRRRALGGRAAVGRVPRHDRSPRRARVPGRHRPAARGGGCGAPGAAAVLRAEL